MPYKVLGSSPKPGVYHGAFVGSIYRVGKWAKAPASLIKEGYGLTYFMELAAVSKYATFHGLDTVFECEVRGLMPMPEKAYFMRPHTRLVRVIAWFGNAPGRTRRPPVMPFPRGTRMAERLKITREIADEERERALLGLGRGNIVERSLK